MANGAEALGKPLVAPQMKPTDELPEGTISVSLIIPAYNIEDYVGEALASALEQSPKFCEIIVIDDGSTDGTKDVIAGFRDPRIRYHYQANQGLGPARNVGLDLAIGEYICFMDGDDILAAGMTRFVQNSLLTHVCRPDIMLFSAIDFDHQTGARLASSEYLGWRRTKVFASGRDALSESLRCRNFPVCAFLYVFARSVTDSPPSPLRFFNIFHEDEIFTPAILLRCGTTVMTSEIFYRRRVRPGSIMTSPAGHKNVVGCLAAATWWVESANSEPIHERNQFVLQANRLYAKAILYASRAKLGARATRSIVKTLSPSYASVAGTDYVLSLVSRRLAVAMISLRGELRLLLAQALANWRPLPNPGD